MYVVRVAGLPERLAQGVAERVVALVDLDAALDRIDADPLLGRVDIDALLARTDLASTVVDAATSTADEALASLRRTTERGDEAVARWSGRLLRRA